MRTNFKLIVSTGSSAVRETRIQSRGSEPISIHSSMDHGPRCPKNARPLHATWQGWDGMGWDGIEIGTWPRVWLCGIARLAAVKENDCNYASLFLNFHAVHLAALPPRKRSGLEWW